MRKTALSLMLVFGLSSLTFAEMMHKEKTLYQRLGGYDAISAVVKDLVVRLVTDKQLGIYFKGLSNDSKNKLIALLCHGRTLYVHRKGHEDRSRRAWHLRLRLEQVCGTYQRNS
jgi:truncated hemoglobin YjbI